MELVKDGLIWRLDDDNLPVSGFFRRLRGLAADMPTVDVFLFAQYRDGYRVAPEHSERYVVQPKLTVGQIDSAQYVIHRQRVGSVRYKADDYKADGEFITTLCEKAGPSAIYTEPQPLTDYNALWRPAAPVRHGPPPGRISVAFSVITPLSEAGNKYIEEAYRSLLAQTQQDWEWVVLENHGGVLPEELRSDSRVRVYSRELEGVGTLKRYLCGMACADIIVELDHDDMLAPRALECIGEAVKGGADFVYSNFAEYQTGTWAPHVYSEGYGWRSRPFSYDGHALLEQIAPPLTPQNLRFVDWAPNHVRAWTRAAYDSVGGHDPERPFGDDHDLVVRFYLAGKRMVHVDECLYLYRRHDENTVWTNNAEIRRQTQLVYNRHVWSLAERFADDNGLLKLDLCVRADAVDGYSRVRPRADFIWPIKDGSAGVLRAHDIIGHLKDPVHTMNEAYRVLAPGGWLMIHVPSSSGLGAFEDPLAVSYWNRLSFRHFTEARFASKLPGYVGRFQVSRVIEWFPNEWHRENNVPYVEAHLIKLAPGYEPMGEVSI